MLTYLVFFAEREVNNQINDKELCAEPCPDNGERTAFLRIAGEDDKGSLFLWLAIDVISVCIFHTTMQLFHTYWM